MKLKEIVQKIHAELFNPLSKSEEIDITGVAPLDKAGPQDLSFFTNSRFEDHLKETKAGAVIVAKPLSDAHLLQVIHPNILEALARVGQMFFSYSHSCQGQSPLAYIAENAKVHKRAIVYPFAFIDEGASVSEGSVIYPHTYVGRNAVIGKDCILFPGVVIMSETELGERVIIHGNTVLGGDGFGFAITKDSLQKIPQTGKVVIGSDVEIGSLTNVDRATFDKTSIGSSTKIDSLVHVGHNVEIGEQSILCGQAGIAGSVKVGNRFVAGGQAAIGHGIEIGDNVRLGGKCGVVRDIKESGDYHGYPHRPANDWRREVTLMKSLPDLIKRVRELEKKLEK
ncbi:MAG: UDP-3-O-(3-hydroxymyristoyl)glucosamine N-acyltransferase [Deltaproteobacteria bacterium]|nr:UDP-3-O-(3-hydroxymyristoyl)glucosamine N-acyltransferase [Deltaproteobacteria bacterium]